MTETKNKMTIKKTLNKYDSTSVFIKHLKDIRKLLNTEEDIQELKNQIDEAMKSYKESKSTLTTSQKALIRAAGGDPAVEKKLTEVARMVQKEN